MRPLLRHGYRILPTELSRVQKPFQRSGMVPVKPDPYSICLRCQLRAFSRRTLGAPSSVVFSRRQTFTRTFALTRSKCKEKESPPQQAEEQEPPISEPNLPSSLERRRTTVSKRLSTLTDSLLTSLNNVSHQVNTYTGTDYTPIITLRNAISTQESTVRTSHRAVASAKEAYDAAHSQQTSAQKEVVGLLERKASWSATDLERYMALIRSEHVNDQDVATSLTTLREREQELEQGRRQLERMERQQYHEEQIWSDTIRRNSTWVTIVLMGVNILLLLVNIVGVEPWRRRRLVKEVKSAINEKAIGPAALPALVKEGVEKEIDDVMDPKGVTLEQIEGEEKGRDAEIALVDVEVEGAIPVALEAEEMGAVHDRDLPKEEQSAPGTGEESPSRLTTWNEHMQDMFSERLISLRRVDITYAALQGAATGVAFMGIIFVLLRPR